MPTLRIHVSPVLKLAVLDAAERSGLSLSEWVRCALDSSSGGGRLPPGFTGAGPPKMEPGRPLRWGYIGIRVDDDAIARYRSAAKLAWLDLSPWAAVIIAVAVGISSLPEQIGRLK